MSTIYIKQIPDDYSEATGLSKYGKSRMPGCKDRLVAAEMNGRYITGLDEHAIGLTKEESKKILQLREHLETVTGKNLSATSDFWESFTVEISSDRDKAFNEVNPMDKIGLTMLIANGYVAPTKDDAYKAEYRNTQYYAYTEESEQASAVSSRKLKDRAIVALSGMSTNKEKMLMIGGYLEGLKYSNKFSEDTLYNMLRAYIESTSLKNAENFLKAAEKPAEELMHKIIVDKALKKGLISKVKSGKNKMLYQYGQVTLGSTVDEVYTNLAKPDFAPELNTLKKEV